MLLRLLESRKDADYLQLNNEAFQLLGKPIYRVGLKMYLIYFINSDSLQEFFLSRVLVLNTLKTIIVNPSPYFSDSQKANT